MRRLWASAWRRLRRDVGPEVAASEVNVRHAAAVTEDIARMATRLLPYSLLTTGLVCPVNVLCAASPADRMVGLLLLALNETIAVAGIIYCLMRRLSATAATTARAYRRDRTVVIVCAAVLGVVWFCMPVALFPGAGTIGRLMIACTCAGVICTSLALVPVPAAQRLLALPLIVGSFIALAMTHDARILGLAALLAIYGLFVSGAAHQLGRFFARFTLLRQQFLEQDTTLQLLLGQGEGPGASLLWETDAQGRLRYVTRALARGLGTRPAQLEGVVLTDLLGPSDTQDDDAPARLVACLDGHVAFRNLVVAVAVPPGSSVAQARWSFTGRPLFDSASRFTGFCGVSSDVTAAHHAAQMASRAERHDPLTGLASRSAFAARLRAALYDLGRRGTPFAVISLDFDNFKSVNDRYGHQVGDCVLAEAARRLRDVCGERMVIGRQGGDEFTALSFETDLIALDRMMRHLVAVIADPFDIDGREIRIGLSIGVSLAPLAGDTVETLLEAADLALYRIKREGGGSVCFYEPGLRQRAEEHRSLLADLRAAVARRDFTVVYQPIVDTQTLALRGFETLLRWERRGYGPVSPERFIRIAEEAGLIGELGAWVLDCACREAAAWPSRMKVAVNVSVSQIEAPGFAQLVAATLARSGLPASRLELEITESIFMDSEASSFGVLDDLRDMGIDIALDDFGRGFSSLGFLRGFTFSKIKMDKDFVREMRHDRRASAVVHAIVSLGAELGVVVTAEGVETPQQLAMLRKMGCTEAQGFLFSAPMPAARLAGLLREGRIPPGILEHEPVPRPADGAPGSLLVLSPAAN